MLDNAFPMSLRDEPCFGVPGSGLTYILRPSAYAIVIGPEGLIATIKTARGHFLPGGGIEQGERAGDTILRECKEECGLDVELSRHIGDARQFIDAHDGYFEIAGSFFLAIPLTASTKAIEPGNETLWLSPRAARRAMTRRFEAWAISLAFPEIA